MMITNPNTLGLFETDIAAASTRARRWRPDVLRRSESAIIGRTSPGPGLHAVHYNLHKTFSRPTAADPSAPWRQGAPRAFLPGPVVDAHAEAGERTVEAGRWFHWREPEHSIGKVQQWYATQGCPALLGLHRRYGRDLRTMSEHAVLNANYLAMPSTEQPDAWTTSSGRCANDVAKHEFTLSMQPARKLGVTAMDAGLSTGYMAPTVTRRRPEC